MERLNLVTRYSVGDEEECSVEVAFKKKKLIGKKRNENISPRNKDEIKFQARLAHSLRITHIKKELAKSVKGLM